MISKATATQLKAMMALTVSNGTARGGFYDRRGRPYLGELTVAGKTGSLARNSPYLHYNWFAGFAPVDRPKVAFAVLLGNPMRWRIKATHAARHLLTPLYQGLQKGPYGQQAAAGDAALVPSVALSSELSWAEPHNDRCPTKTAPHPRCHRARAPAA